MIKSYICANNFLFDAMVNKIFGVLVVFILLFSACKDEETPLSSTKQLVSFSLLESDNQGKISGDVEAVIQGDQVVLPFYRSNNLTSLIATFVYEGKALTINGVEQKSGVTANDYSQPLIIAVVAEDGSKVSYTVKIDLMNDDPDRVLGVPEFVITLNDPSITEIPSKDDYLDATLTVKGKGVYEDYTGKTQIKGRGNSTWGYPKKPYRLKLDKKAEICGFGEAKNYVLLANYIDPTLMLNSVAFKIGHLLELPFTNHAIPVDVVLNGKYKGSYLLTEQIEVKKNRVDLDEDNSVMWELDSYFDEDPKFKSEIYNLPVMVKDPDLSAEQFDYWRKDFNAFMGQFAKEPLNTNTYVDMIDIESVVKYLITFNLVHNMEINHPKSIFIHKEKGGKYVMGPLWDFDWAFDYEGTGVHFGRYNTPLFSNQVGEGIGTVFFQRFLQDSRVRALYKEVWQDFKKNKLSQLLQYIDDYSEVLKPSAKKDSEIWEKTRSYDAKVRELKTWLKNRANYIDQEVSQF